MFMEARDHALFHAAARTSARLPPPLPDVSLPAASYPDKIYPTVKETGFFMFQQLLRVHATNPTDLICLCEGSINSSVGREGNPSRVSWFLPQIIETSWGN